MKGAGVKDLDDIAGLMRGIGEKARAAAAELGFAPAERKEAALIGAAEALLIKGRRSEEIEAVLGYSGRAALVHRDDMAM